MKKSLRIILIGATLILWMPVVQATTTCNPKFSFLGFSADGEKGYWEKDISGECIPVRSVRGYRLETLRSERPFRWLRRFLPTSASEIAPGKTPDFLFWTYTSEMEDPLDPSDPDSATWVPLAQYRLARTRLIQHLNRPPSATLWSLGKAARNAPVRLKKLDEEKLQVTTSVKKCVIQFPSFQDWEGYLYGPGKIKAAHYHPQEQFWLVITSHCNIGNSTPDPCERDDAIAIYDMKECR